jgi:hypothetical protein
MLARILLLACLHDYFERILTKKCSYFNYLLKSNLDRSDFLDLDVEKLSSSEEMGLTLFTKLDLNQPDILWLVSFLYNSFKQSLECTLDWSTHVFDQTLD